MSKLEKLASVTGLDVRHLCMVMVSHHVAEASLQYAHDLLALAGVGILHVSYVVVYMYRDIDGATTQFHETVPLLFIHSVSLCEINVHNLTTASETTCSVCMFSQILVCLCSVFC